MKKIIVMAVVLISGINVYKVVKNNVVKYSDLQLENIEMLANAQEGGEFGYGCKNAYSEWKTEEQIKREGMCVEPREFTKCLPNCPTGYGYPVRYGVDC